MRPRTREASEQINLQKIVLYNFHLDTSGFTSLPSLLTFKAMDFYCESKSLKALLKGLPNLTALHLEFARTAHGLVHQVRSAPKLKKLVLSNMDLNARDFAAICSLKQLGALKLFYHSVQTADCGAVANLAVLKSFVLDNLNGESLTEEQYRTMVASLPDSLTKLTVTGLNIRGASVADVARLEKLKSLDLSGLVHADEALENMAPVLRRIRKLNLAGSDVKARGMSSIAAHAAGLQQLFLDYTDIDKESLQALSSHRPKVINELTYVSLMGCFLDSQMLDALSRIDSVTELLLDTGPLGGYRQAVQVFAGEDGRKNADASAQTDI